MWCLNRNLSVGKDGWVIRSSDFGLEWISYFIEFGNGGEIVDEFLVVKVDGELIIVYFDAIIYLMAGLLEKKVIEDTKLKVVVSELFGYDECFFFYNEVESIDEEMICIESGDFVEESNLVSI